MKFLFLLQFLFCFFHLNAQVDTSYHHKTNKIRTIRFQPNIFGFYKTNFYYKTGELNVETIWNKKRINVRSKSYFKNGNFKVISLRPRNKSIEYYESGELKSIRKKTKKLMFSKEYYINGSKSRVVRNAGERITCEYSKTLEDGMIDLTSYTCKYNDIEVIKKEDRYFDLNGNRIILKAHGINKEWYRNGNLMKKSKGGRFKIIRKEWNESGDLILDEELER